MDQVNLLVNCMYAHLGDQEAWVSLMLRNFKNIDLKQEFNLKNDQKFKSFFKICFKYLLQEMIKILDDIRY
jgi:hypothetical protein